MTQKEIALQFDAQDKPVEAANAYEEAIKEPDSELATYLNLAVLYFSCQDGGYSAHRCLSAEFLDYSWKRANQVLDEAESKFGQNDEIDFWRRYFRWRVLFEDEAIMESERFVRSDSLIPYFYLVLTNNKEEYLLKAKKLFEQVAEGKTAKDRWIRSILKSNVLK